MRKKHYKIGHVDCFTYFTTVGKGFEVGFCFGKKTVFVGNFIHSKEAVQYYAHLNREVRTFGQKYWISESASTIWYNNFFKNYLYTNYYTFLDKLFSKYQKNYTYSFKKDQTKYMKMRKNWTTTEKMKFKVAV